MKEWMERKLESGNLSNRELKKRRLSVKKQRKK